MVFYMSHMTVLYSPLQKFIVGRENETTIEKGIGNGAPVFTFLVCYFFSFCLPTRSPLAQKMTLPEENIYNFSNNLKT